jgi:Fe-S oxidoreductase
MKATTPEHASVEMVYDHPDYANPASLDRELRRVADICHQCRRCLPLCPSFPRLFELVDATPEEVEGVTARGFDEVNELCFHCKLCYNHCPYTPPHEWDVDFPALMRRQQIARARRDGIPVARRLTTQTDRIGRVGALAPGLVNLANRNPLSRFLMEKTIGIDRRWVQPAYHRETAEDWWRNTTCSVNYSDPRTARAAVCVLERSRVRVDLAYEVCCGMPYTDTGDLDSARRNAERNVAALLPHVEAGARIAVPGPSCSLLLKTEYPKLIPSAGAKRVAERSSTAASSGRSARSRTRRRVTCARRTSASAPATCFASRAQRSASSTRAREWTGPGACKRASTMRR